MDQDVAVVHGHYLSHGGAEVVAEQLARVFDAPLYYGFGDPDAVPDNGTEHIGLFTDRPWNRFRESGLLRDAYYMWAFQHVPELHQYDVLIQSGNEMGWYVPPDDQVVVKYVHSTPRAAYDRFPDVGADPVARLQGFLTRLLYHPHVTYPDKYVANSDLVARRVRRYWGIDDVGIAYPPVEVDSYHQAASEDFYLTVSRLAASKCVDEIVRAFAGRDDRLIVGGTGPREDELRRLAGPNVEVRGFLDEAEKRDLLARAKAFVFAARNEDFGIVPIEALASGTPVIGVRDGFTQYQIRDGENGLLFARGSDSLAAALDRFEREGVTMSGDDLVAEAERYGLDAFRSRMRGFVEAAVADARIDPHG
jgi:glycosyltransferase involved in cell wall biosynthesis